MSTALVLPSSGEWVVVVVRGMWCVSDKRVRYLNDTQEIDMEFLGRQMNDSYSPVNLVLHSTLSGQNGGDASKTPTYKIIPLPFDSRDGFHEYRFGNYCPSQY
jgi:hypothetical protein